MVLIHIRLNRCNTAILENYGTIKSVPNCYKSEEMLNKAADNYPHTLEFIPEWYRTQKMCDKAVSTYPSTIITKISV